MKREMKQKMVKCFLSLEVLTVLFFYLFGVQGLPALYRLKQESVTLEKEIECLHTEVAALETTIQEWHTYPYYKEKIAREQLQMARQGDVVYYIPQTERNS